MHLLPANTLTAAIVLVINIVNICQGSPGDTSINDIVNANNAFSMELYEAMKDVDGNLVVCPLSQHTILSLLSIGAAGETAISLSAGLYLPESRSQVEKGFGQILDTLKSNKSITLNIANKIFVQHDISVKDSFRNSAIENFQSDIEAVDFNSNPELARSTINSWVEEKTNNRIQGLIEQGFLDENTLMVLVNAVYFKSGWMKPFHEKHTVTAPFYLSSKVSQMVQMMSQADKFRYGVFPELKMTVLNMPYKSPAFSMLIFLPMDVDGLPELERRLTSINVTHLRQSIFHTQIHVLLPRFRIEMMHDMKKPMKKLGINYIFQNGADFSGISNDPIAVTKIVQKTFIEVMEKGTEASAATGAGLAFLSGYDPSPTAEFKADHPFIFMVIDNRINNIIFIGRFVGNT